MVGKALAGEALTIYGDGQPVRDYVFIDDVVRALLLAGSQIDSLNGNYYFIGSGTGTRLVDAVNLVAERAARKTGHRPPVVHVDAPNTQLAIEERSFVTDTARFSRATGWMPGVSLEQGIDRTVEHHLNILRTGQTPSVSR
jgi:nucleoside-diphosphate-sugar epimerase